MTEKIRRLLTETPSKGSALRTTQSAVPGQAEPVAYKLSGALGPEVSVNAATYGLHIYTGLALGGPHPLVESAKAWHVFLGGWRSSFRRWFCADTCSLIGGFNVVRA